VPAETTNTHHDAMGRMMRRETMGTVAGTTATKARWPTATHRQRLADDHRRPLREHAYGTVKALTKAADLCSGAVGQRSRNACSLQRIACAAAACGQ